MVVGNGDSLSEVLAYVNEASSSIRKFPGIDSILLFGSYARGDTNPTSDVDVLMITKKEIPRTEIMHSLPESPIKNKLKISIYSPSFFQTMYQNGALFVYHILSESKIIFDDGFIESLRKIPFPLSLADCQNELRLLKVVLSLYEDPTPFNNSFANAYSRLYSILGRVIILGVALRTKPIFNKKKALERFLPLYPSTAENVNALTELEPFTGLMSENYSGLPFSPEGTPDRFYSYVLKLKEVIDVVERT